MNAKLDLTRLDTQTPNRPSLSISDGVRWLREGWTVLKRDPVFWGFVAANVLMFRYLLDIKLGAITLTLSYTTDALLFAAAAAAYEYRFHREKAPLRLRNLFKRKRNAAIRQRLFAPLEGKRLAVIRAGLWGLITATISVSVYAMVSGYATEFAVAANSLGRLHSLLTLFSGLAGAYVFYLAALFPNLAAVAALRGNLGFAASGQTALTALRTGIAPLTLLFLLFLPASLVASYVSVILFSAFYGFAPDDLAQAAGAIFGINGGYLVALFFAVALLLSMFGPIARDLMPEALIREEVREDQHKSLAEPLTVGKAHIKNRLIGALHVFAILALFVTAAYETSVMESEAPTAAVGAVAAYLLFLVFALSASAAAWFRGESGLRRWFGLKVFAFGLILTWLAVFVAPA